MKLLLLLLSLLGLGLGLWLGLGLGAGEGKGKTGKSVCTPGSAEGLLEGCAKGKRVGRIGVVG